MRKQIVIMAVTGVMTLGVAFSAFAGQWQVNTNGWWYDNGNGSYPANGWNWIDGNGDGIAECYYFDQYGYCLINTTTPDGYSVDGNGAWILNGAIQSKNVGNGNPDTSGKSNVNALILYDTEPVMNENIQKDVSAVTHKENASWAKVLRFPYYNTYIEYYTTLQLYR